MKINLKNQTGEITLKSDHSMFIGNKPSIITNDMYTDIIPKVSEEHKIGKGDFESFGLWESASPNYTTYYPDVTADDLLPQNDEFIFPIFRCLSATILWKGYRPIDFTKPGVLRNSMNLLVGQTINVDHEVALGNGMGVVKSVAWQESYTSNGVKVPAGINGEFMIDGKSNPRIARGIMCKPPIIHSNSVSVRFTWEPSHKLKDNDEFYSKLGTRDDKGNLYRLIVTEILQYSETSLVPHGADPYAQVINEDGIINNPKYADGVYNFSTKDEKGKENKLSHFVDYKSDLTADEATILLKLNKDNNNNQKEENMDLLKELEIILGLEVDSLKEADKDKISQAVQKFNQDKVDAAVQKANEDLIASKQEVTELTTERDNLSSELETLKKDDNVVKAQKYDLAITSKREEVKKLYNLSKGDDAKPEMLSMIESVEPEVLETLSTDYASEVELKFPNSCKKCGSTELSRSTVIPDNEEGEKEVTLTQTREDLKKLARKNK